MAQIIIIFFHFIFLIYFIQDIKEWKDEYKDLSIQFFSKGQLQIFTRKNRIILEYEDYLRFIIL